MKAVFAVLRGEELLKKIYDPPTIKLLETKLDFALPFLKMEDLESRAGEWEETEIIFSTWGMPALDGSQLERYFPRLKAVFYAAGSVQHFARPFLERGVRIFSAADANGVPVAEFTAAQIVLANKGYFQAAKLYSAGAWQKAKQFFLAFPGNYDTAVGIAGAGKIGREVIARLKDLKLRVNVFDPFLSAANAEKMGVCKLETLEELFAQSFVVSNHLANNEQTKGIMRYRHFSLMDDHGVFINTARGAQVVEDDLVRALREKPTRTALLDVSWPEPVPEDHPFLTMDNVFLSPHIAGSSGAEQVRMGKYMAEEYDRFARGAPALYEVTAAMLETMA